MIHAEALLFKLVVLIDNLPQPKPEPTGGRPLVYPETLFLKALVIMTLRQLYKPGELLVVLEQPTMLPLKTLLTDHQGRFPCRRTWERRLARLPESLPQRIGLIGRTLVEMIRPWKNCGRAAALDSTVLHASYQLFDLSVHGLTVASLPPWLLPRLRSLIACPSWPGGTAQGGTQVTPRAGRLSYLGHAMHH